MGACSELRFYLGKIISLLLVVPNLVLYTSELTKIIDYCYSTGSFTIPAKLMRLYQVEYELQRWLDLRDISLSRPP